VRTRFFVAVAALMAASALVALPGPASSSAPSAVRTIDPARLTALTLVLPADRTVSAIATLDPALDSEGRLESGSLLRDPAHGGEGPAFGRPVLDQPAPRMGSVAKNPWRWDPEISWYGPGFYGNRTACGQTYTREILGVAHRSLPCGTLVSFRNPSNGRTVTVPVIDRGPYVAGRTWDLSRAACEALDHCWTGPIQWRWGGR
jgi:hypothetical protein